MAFPLTASAIKFPIRIFSLSPDKNACAMPENWPNNELIGSKVINPPPKDVKTAADRLKSSEGYDWWFTYRDLD